MPEYKQILCNKCGKPIRFFKIKFTDGKIKTVPHETDSEYMSVSSGEKTDEGNWIYISRKGYKPHNCPMRQNNQTQETLPEETKQEEKINEEEKPPF